MRTLFTCVLAAVLLGCPDAAKGRPVAVPSGPPVPLTEDVRLEGAGVYPFSQAGSTLRWTGSKVTGRHQGTFAIFSGVVEVVGADVTTGRVRAEIELASVTSDSEKLTQHLKGPDFFAADVFPHASFVSTAIAKTATGHAVTGNLTLRGVTRSITFPATITLQGGELRVKADFAINRKDFGVAYPGRPDDLIADEVGLSLELHARKRG